MKTESVWLGPLRGPVKLAMIGFMGLTLALYLWLLFGHFGEGEAIGMYEMVRPAGRPVVQLMIAALCGTLLFTSLYLSDRIGHIEPQPTGPMDILSLVLSRLAMVGIVMTVLVMFYEVTSRYVFEKPTLWANELSLWIAAFVFLLAGQYAMQQRTHIRIYIIYDTMPRWMQKLSDCLSVALLWIFAISVTWGGYDEAKAKLLRMETLGTAWDPPIPATIKAGILVMLCLVAIQALSNLIADWHKRPESHSPADDIDEFEIESIRRTLKGTDNG